MSEKQLKNILVPLDGSKSSFRALSMGISIASKYKSTITVIYIHDLPIMLDYAVIDPVGKRDVIYGEKILEKAKKLVGKKSKFQSKILSGNTAKKILEFAGKKFDIIIMGHRGLGSSKELFLGSVSHHILQKSKIPVLVVR
jgi:nucleotide-binding universal stress UspA family protein